MQNCVSTFISGDWGTSRLRLRLVRSDPLGIRAEAASDVGIGRVFADWQASGRAEDRADVYLRALAPTLERLRDEAGSDLRGVPIVLSGMASSTVGLRELPYTSTPFDLASGSPPIAKISPGRL